ncbi:MAG: ABC transporter ATP-binding protein [Pseudomonadota bacterium]
MSEYAFVLKNLSKQYRSNNLPAVDNISLQIQKNGFAAILGPSGSGKSTLLNMMGGIESPDTGQLFIMEEKMAVSGWNRVRQKTIGFVFQNFNLFPTLTALENIEMPMFGVIRGRKNRRARATALLKRVDLLNRASHKPSQLSGGECQRVAIARSLANSPQILLADEPTGNLDSGTSLNIVSLFKDIHTINKTTLVVVTHDEKIAEHASLILNLKDGKLVSEYRKPITK